MNFPSFYKYPWHTRNKIFAQKRPARRNVVVFAFSLAGHSLRSATDYSKRSIRIRPRMSFLLSDC